MTDQSPRLRRPELEAAFDYMAGLTAQVDFTGLTDPKEMWLAAMRGTLPHYGALGREVSLDGVAFTPITANGVACEWVVAEGASPTRRIVYIHGGGWAGGSPLDYRPLSATLARMTGASILMVDYRLAPAHRYPAGLDDCVSAYEWALANGPSGPAPAEHISVVGDSAGGNLSAATCVRLATTGGRLPDRLALVAGTLDNVSMDKRIGLDDPICTPEALALSVEFYLPPGQSAADPEISPVFAPDVVLAKFPPTLIQVSTIESLAYDSKAFAARLEAVGVRVNLALWPDLPHVWHAFLGHFPEAREALAEIADFVRRP